ncbi:uncharacterized protein STEHIDRAFT_141108 [Stereum hirsutum FP-91666 SS1]|uniref:uncharacterized protein n=1 Tax=Stereum hirsutum (strain FP-91666) TaxID=721885 RepID=UPI000444A0F4|nr:uncharacterized protein STEHIDRAFT_141108 [Stereum hirsutum FP-91666 SS1]EIM83294.1 hypothetical protein STEHIDRAFT_141108 [Stereum hirsutum FP-91666 SS1]
MSDYDHDSVQGSQASQMNDEERQRKQDAELAVKMSNVIDPALDRMKPLLKLITERLARAKRDQEKEELDEEALVKDVRPLIESAYNVLQETLGGIKALDPGGKVSQQSSRRAADHQATPEEQHLAESLATLTGEVTETIENAKNVIQDMPHAKSNLGPLLDALTQPLAQIVGGVGLVLNGVLTLLGNILNGIGLGGILNGILDALGLNKLLGSIGLGGLGDSLGGGNKMFGQDDKKDSDAGKTKGIDFGKVTGGATGGQGGQKQGGGVGGTLSGLTGQVGNTAGGAASGAGGALGGVTGGLGLGGGNGGGNGREE